MTTQHRHLLLAVLGAIVIWLLFFRWPILAEAQNLWWVALLAAAVMRAINLGWDGSGSLWPAVMDLIQVSTFALAGTLVLAYVGVGLPWLAFGIAYRFSVPVVHWCGVFDTSEGASRHLAHAA